MHANEGGGRSPITPINEQSESEPSCPTKTCFTSSGIVVTIVRNALCEAYHKLRVRTLGTLALILALISKK